MTIDIEFVDDAYNYSMVSLICTFLKKYLIMLGQVKKVLTSQNMEDYRSKAGMVCSVVISQDNNIKF